MEKIKVEHSNTLRIHYVDFIRADYIYYYFLKSTSSNTLKNKNRIKEKISKLKLT